ncbi:hypothetical protein [Methylocystis sp. S23]|jgi:hypothetical protein
MASNRIKTLALAAAVVTCAGVGYSSVAEAHHRTARHYGWHSGWHRDWHNHRRVHYGYMRPATYAYGGYPAYGCATPGYYGYAGDGGLFGMGFDGGGLLGLGLGPL